MYILKLTMGFKQVLLIACLSLIAPQVRAVGNNAEFDHLYNSYFPKKGETVASSVYRKSFDRTLFGQTPGETNARGRQLFYAFHGDAQAFHLFLHNPDRDVNGAQGEEWSYECLLLLLKMGDRQFAGLVSREDSETRETVGTALESLVNWKKHSFPKTRKLYTFRRNPHGE